MIEGLSIANFKAFGGEPQEIPLKPLTIVFGANSSGKSSILHSLLYLNHATITGELDVKYPQLAERTVDLGGIAQFIHGARRQTDNVMVLGVDLDVVRVAEILDQTRTHERVKLGGSESQDMRELFSTAKKLRVEFSIRYFDGIELGGLGLMQSGKLGQCFRFEILLDNERFLVASEHGASKLGLQVTDLATDHPVLLKLLKFLYQAKSFEMDVSESVLKELQNEADHLVERMYIPIDGMLPSELNLLFDDEPDMAKMSLLEQYLPSLMSELIEAVSGLVRQDTEQMRYLGPLRSNPPRNIAFSDDDTMLRDADGGRAWLEVAGDEDLLGKVNSWLSGEDKLNASYELTFEKYYSNRRDLPHLLPDSLRAALDTFLDQHFEEEKETEENVEFLTYRFISEWVSGWSSVSVEGLSDDITDLEAELSAFAKKFREIRDQERLEYPTGVYLKDTKHDVEVSHRDVGIGISQVLPVLVHALGSKEKLLLIEQPELHLHPALQAVMGDVFIESALGDGHNRCLLETHSEHLILRILRRIREQSKKDNPAIKASDVAVLYVMPEKDGSKIVQIRIDEDGEFMDPWPGGFFPERLEELI